MKRIMREHVHLRFACMWLSQLQRSPQQAVAEATEQRKEEHEEFITFQTQNSAALQLIEKAKNKLSFSDACFSSSAARRAGVVFIYDDYQDVKKHLH